MKFSELIKNLEIKNRGGEGDPTLSDIVFDSRKAEKGSLFIAVPGFTVDGNKFVKSAVQNGAVAVVCTSEPECKDVPWIVVDDIRRVMGELAIKFWNIDFSKIFTVGITGTNGKTTTATLYRDLFSIVHEHEHSWMFGTIAYEMGTVVEDASRTTPEAVDLLRYIGNAEKQPEALTMEVASHALELSRVEGFLFDIAVWTNLTQDHLDFHKTMDEYYQAKKKLFTKNLKCDGVAVINIDDTWGAKLANELSSINPVTYGTADNATVKIENYDCSWDGIKISIKYENEIMTFYSSLVGEFNVYNVTAMIAGALAKGISRNDIVEALGSLSGVAGRMEKLDVQLPFSVVVDYAHTPDALTNVLDTAEKLTEGHLICVYGCGGDRDKTKRPLMAEAVSLKSDFSYVTSDNPRTEDPKSIIEDVLEGIPLDHPFHVEIDRREAIRKAMNSAVKDDCVVIAGKGHEDYQEINGVKHHFDDREVAREIAEEINNG